MEQTAVEWLEVQIKNTPTVENLMNQLDAFIKEAKEMEKQQIIDAYKEGMGNVDGWIVNENGVEQYYNETYEKQRNSI